MSTLVLSTVGAAVGSVFGPVGTILGRAVGAMAGAALDQALFAPKGADRSIGRLADLDVQASTEGVAIPRVYGRVRIAGQVIWATRLEEEATAEDAGGKGGGSSTVTRYTYFANFAVGLCEGPVARIGRVWANGEPLDVSDVVMRVHLGHEAQGPDSLIEAKQGEAVPAYRGLAYVVFERLPLEPFGNVLPQLSFEVIRPVGRLEAMIRAVTLIPGATEFGYPPTAVVRTPGPGIAEAENRHVTTAESDVAAALDELQAVCPNLSRVALVVSWFGDDLRAGVCTIRPKVETAGKVTDGATWSVAGLSRETATIVSTVGGRPAYGGTPSDASVVALIGALKARGLAVTLYPLMMMDIAPGNTLPDPWTGSAGQPAYPWRGRITCDPAPGRAGSPDRTAAANAEIAAFLGTADPSHFTVVDGAVDYSGPDEWRYRRMILHTAALAAAAGGVEAFLVGSEMRALTAVRAASGTVHPFVAGLRALARDVRTLLGATTKISYAADWTEWNTHRPADGSGDLTFHLDPLWADPDIDFVGIDLYAPLADWREGDHLDAAFASGPHDRAYLAANVAGGEDFDWYYASDADRRSQTRTPITDGLGKPWVFRAKDLVGWWSNRHTDRIAGVEGPLPTDWLPGLKPIRFTELGCPAVDKGANQPNVFPDTLSSEGGIPRFSSGGRDDAQQRRVVEALLARFDPDAPGFRASDNPVSAHDGRRMVDHVASHVWTFDARPFPAFPLAGAVWADGANWTTGHWLNGRLGAAPLDDLVRTLLADAGVTDVDTDGLTACFDGYTLQGRGTARSALEPLQALTRMAVLEREATLVFSDRPVRPVLDVARQDCAEEAGDPVVVVRRDADGETATEIAVTFFDTANDFRQASVMRRRDGAQRALDLSLPVTAAAEVIAAEAEALLRDRAMQRETVTFALPPSALGLEAGDCIRLDGDGRRRTMLVTRIEDGPVRRIEARTVEPALRRHAPAAPDRSRQSLGAAPLARPVAIVLDIPRLDGTIDAHRPYLAAAAAPWPGPLTAQRIVGATAEAIATVPRPATLGRLVAPLAAGPVWRLDRGGAIEVELTRGTLTGVAREAMLDGANTAAIGDPANGWEIVGFEEAVLVGPRRYRLAGLLRGRLGTEKRAEAGSPAGADFVLLDRSLRALPLSLDALGRPLSLKVGKAGRPLDDPAMTALGATPRGAGLVPWSPVHLKATRAPSGDVAIRWIRRTRIGGDDWDAHEVPLGEGREAYEVRVRLGETVVRRIAATSTAAVYGAADQIADHGSAPISLDLAVAQVSETRGPGPETRKVFHV